MLSLRLPSVAMTDEDRQYARRLGFWLRMARERAGKSQQGAAEHVGLSAKSKSTISDYENGVTLPSLATLRRLAAWYDVPLEVFTHPEPTPEERLDELARGAAIVAREDLAKATEERPADEGAPADGRGKRPA